MRDYKAEFSAAVTDIIAQDIMDRDERINAVYELIRKYIDDIGKTPDSSELERLSDYILREELTDKSRGKVQNVEYPFLSERQLARRHGGEASMHNAEEIGIDGKNYRKPTRRTRKHSEIAYIDRYALSRNKERAAQYRKDIAVGAVVVYNLYDTGGELTEEFVHCRGLGDKVVEVTARCEIIDKRKVGIEWLNV